MSGQLLDRPADGTRLRALMEERGITPSNLTLLTGISERLIVKYRTGRVVPRRGGGGISQNAIKIARALDADPEELFPPRSAETAA